MASQLSVYAGHMRFLKAIPALALALSLPACGLFAPAQTPTARTTRTTSAGSTTHAAPRPDAVGVMIENAPQARPQSGIDRAQVVYEMMAEGGITRYLCYFNLNQAVASIGPVRSARIYYVDIDKTYGLPLAHAGGNVDALRAIPLLHIPNLDGLFAAHSYFWRISSRRAPHNLYTSTASLQKGITAMHLTTRPLRLWPTGAAPKGGTPTSSVRIQWVSNSLYSYETSFSYQNGSYVYGINGTPDVQADAHEVKVQDAVILQAVTAPDPDPYTPGSIRYQLTSGTGWLLRDGLRYRIDWQFGPNGFTFSSGGTTMPLAPGHVFVQVLPEPIAPVFPRS